MLSFKIIFSGIAGTLLMTVFMEFVSIIMKNPYHVVRILSRMLYRDETTAIKRTKLTAFVVASIVHYFIGVMFAYVFSFSVEQNLVDLNAFHAIVFGALAGLTGVIGWRITFAVHPNPPPIDRNQYFLLIWLGHLLFAIGMFLVLITF